jgi:hypothetical protein
MHVIFLRFYICERITLSIPTQTFDGIDSQIRAVEYLAAQTFDGIDSQIRAVEYLAALSSAP